jgi:hypothetical protein
MHDTYRATKGDKVFTQDFESVSDYVRYTSETPAASDTYVASREDNPDFFRTKTFEEAVALASSGWPEGAARVAELRDGCEAFLAAAKAAKTKGYGWDVTGHFIDVGRLLSGEPECCGYEQEQEGGLGSQVASIRLNACVSGSVSADAIIARGLTVLVAADLLESCGIRCEILVSQATYTDHNRRLVENNVAVKAPGAAVDIDKLAFAIAHPGFFRRLGFAFCESHGHSPNGCRVASMSDYEQRDGTVDVDGVCTGDGLSQEELRANVLAIAKACGLEFSSDELEEITKA